MPNDPEQASVWPAQEESTGGLLPKQTAAQTALPLKCKGWQNSTQRRITQRLRTPAKQ